MKDKHKVFVIDDDQSARNGLARLVRTAGYNVSTYSSANEFLVTLHPNISGCVILDARMPGMSGEDLVAKLMGLGENLSVIFVTADDDPAIKQKAKTMGAAGFFLKPVDGAALLDEIDWAIREKTNN